MRALLPIAVLLATAIPAYALPVPEPDTLPLMAIGALALAFVAMRRKSK